MQSKLTQGYFKTFFSNQYAYRQGFLPEQMPLKCLPDTCQLARRINTLVKSIPELLVTKNLRQVVDRLDTDFAGEQLNVKNEAEQNVAMLMLCLLTQAYIWQEPKQPANKIPEILAINLLSLSKQLQRLPSMTYSDYILNNWQLRDPNKGILLENIEPLFMLTGTSDEAWFIKIHVAIEALCAKAIASACFLSQLTNAPEFDLAENEMIIIKSLNDIGHGLQDATKILQRMKEGCDPNYFFNVLIKRLEGWEKVKTVSASGNIEQGVYFQGVEDSNKLHAYKGASGAQSSIVPLLDNILGVKHKIDESFTTLLHFQQFMPRQHRALINAVNGDKLRTIINQACDEQLKTAWLTASKMLASFRLAHLALVEQYILNPARAQGMNMAGITGTGGSDPTKYLGQRYLETNNMLRAKM